MKNKRNVINPTLKKEIIKTFMQTIADLKDYNEVSLFFADFLTESEVDTLSKRLAVAYWLKKNRSYINIKDNLKVSTATIAEVSSMLKTKGIQLSLKKIEAEEWANIWVKKINKYIK